MGKLPLRTEEVPNAIPWELATLPENTLDWKAVALVEMTDDHLGSMWNKQGIVLK